jgi:lipoate-protein ligase A
VTGLVWLPLLLLAVESPFEASDEQFSSAAACKARLETMADAARHQRFDAVEGPYDIEAGDVRIHTVAAEGHGHRIAEHRCLAEKLSSRSWSHSLEPEDPAFTVESVARNADWLKKGGGQK